MEKWWAIYEHILRWTRLRMISWRKITFVRHLPRFLWLSKSSDLNVYSWQSTGKTFRQKKNIHVISTCCSVPNQKTNPFYPLCACFATSDKWKTCYQNRKLKAISVDPLTDTCFSIYLFGNAKTLAPCRTNVRVANKLQTTQLIEQFRMGKTNQSWTQYIFYRIGYDMAFFCMIFPLWVREYNFIICLWFIHNVFVCVLGFIYHAIRLYESLL